jgi:hypothetical protein
MLCAGWTDSAQILYALRTRHGAILSGLECLHYTHEHEGCDMHGHLLNLMIQLPFIMETLDVVMRTNNKSERPAFNQLLQLCSSLNAQLLAWHEKLKIEVHGQLYWTVPSIAKNPADDPNLGSIFPLAFHFPSLKLAQLLLLYWSTLILLFRTTQDIQKRLKRKATSGIATPHPVGQRDRNKSELCSNNNYPPDDRMLHLANNISQSLEYCYHSKNGTLGPQSTIFAVWAAESVYESLSGKRRELTWCSELGNMTAPDSRFDLHVIKFSADGYGTLLTSLL